MSPVKVNACRNMGSKRTFYHWIKRKRRLAIREKLTLTWDLHIFDKSMFERSYGEVHIVRQFQNCECYLKVSVKKMLVQHLCFSCELSDSTFTVFKKNYSS